MTITTTDELAGLMAALDINIRVTDGPELRTVDGWQHNAYRFTLEIRGEPLLSHAPYVAGLALDRPRGADILGAVISDMQSVEPYAVPDEEEERSVMAQERAQWPTNWDQWADDLGLVTDARSARKAADDFREIMARRWLIRDRLGAENYARLLDVAL